MDIFAGAAASIAGWQLSNLTLSPMAQVSIPAMGQVSPDQLAMPAMPQMTGGYSPYFQPNPAFAAGVSQIVGGVTGTGPFFPNVEQSLIEMAGYLPNPFPGYARDPFPGYGLPDTFPGYESNQFPGYGTPNPSPGYVNNPFPGYGPPNPFYGAQLYGNFNSFYAGIGAAFTFA